MGSDDNLFHFTAVLSIFLAHCVSTEVVIGNIAAVVVWAGNYNLQNLFWGIHKLKLDYTLRWLRWLILKKQQENNSNLDMTCKSIYPHVVVALEQFISYILQVQYRKQRNSKEMNQLQESILLQCLYKPFLSIKKHIHYNTQSCNITQYITWEGGMLYIIRSIL